MATPEFDDIKDIIKNKPRKAIQVHFEKDPPGEKRKLWPHVIGWSADPSGNNVEKVLCYQYDGYTPSGNLATPHPARANFRCFKVENLKELTIVNFEASPNPPPDPPSWEPIKFKYKDVKRQNCVETVDEFR